MHSQGEFALFIFFLFSCCFFFLIVFPFGRVQITEGGFQEIFAFINLFHLELYGI